jgi:ankyrin repeat protein
MKNETAKPSKKNKEIRCPSLLLSICGANDSILESTDKNNTSRKHVPGGDIDRLKILDNEMLLNGATREEALSYQDPQTGFTPLHCATQVGNYNIVEHLLKLGADPNVYSKPLESSSEEENDHKICGTPLHFALLGPTFIPNNKKSKASISLNKTIEVLLKHNAKTELCAYNQKNLPVSTMAIAIIGAHRRKVRESTEEILARGRVFKTYPSDIEELLKELRNTDFNEPRFQSIKLLLKAGVIPKEKGGEVEITLEPNSRNKDIELGYFLLEHNFPIGKSKKGEKSETITDGWSFGSNAEIILKEHYEKKRRIVEKSKKILSDIEI